MSLLEIRNQRLFAKMGKRSKRLRTSPAASEESALKKKRNLKASKQLLLSDCPLNQAKVSKTVELVTEGAVVAEDASQTLHPSRERSETPLSLCELKGVEKSRTACNAATNTDNLEMASLMELKTLFVKQCVLISQTLSNIFRGQQLMASRVETLCNQTKVFIAKNRPPCVDDVPAFPTTSDERLGRRLQPCKISLSIFQNQLNYGKWHTKYRAKSSLSSLLRCDFHEVDLQSVTRLSSSPNWQNYLLSFQQDVIPQMLFKSSSLLHRFGICPKKVYYEPPIVNCFQTRGAYYPHTVRTEVSSNRPKISEHLNSQSVEPTFDLQVKESFSELALTEQERLILALKELVQDFEKIQDSSISTPLQKQDVFPEVSTETDTAEKQSSASKTIQPMLHCLLDSEEQSMTSSLSSTPLLPPSQAGENFLEEIKSASAIHSLALLSEQTGCHLSGSLDTDVLQQSYLLSEPTVLEASKSLSSKDQKSLGSPQQGTLSSQNNNKLTSFGECGFKFRWFSKSFK